MYSKLEQIIDTTEHVVSVHVDTRNKIYYQVIMLVLRRSQMMAEGDILYRLIIAGILRGLACTLGRVTDPYPVR